MRGKWGWDIPLKPEVKKGFNLWVKSIRHHGNFCIPRCWNTELTIDSERQLHCFTDASQIGYGAVCYKCVIPIGPNPIPRVDFIIGKGHVVPLDSSKASHHNLTPRLELVAGVKGVDIVKAVKKLMKVPFDRTFVVRLRDSP